MPVDAINSVPQQGAKADSRGDGLSTKPASSKGVGSPCPLSSASRSHDPSPILLDKTPSMGLAVLPTRKLLQCHQPSSCQVVGGERILRTASRMRTGWRMFGSIDFLIPRIGAAEPGACRAGSDRRANRGRSTGAGSGVFQSRLPNGRAQFQRALGALPGHCRKINRTAHPLPR